LNVLLQFTDGQDICIAHRQEYRLEPVFKKIAHLVGRLGSGPRLVGRIGSEVQVRASFQKNAHLVGRLGSGLRLVGRIGSEVQVRASFQQKIAHLLGLIGSEKVK